MGLVKIHLKLENMPSAWNVTTTSKKYIAPHFTWGRTTDVREMRACQQLDNLGYKMRDYEFPYNFQKHSGYFTHSETTST